MGNASLICHRWQSCHASDRAENVLQNIAAMPNNVLWPILGHGVTYYTYYIELD